MKLATLIEYKACFDLLSDKENKHERLTPEEYKRFCYARGQFDYELAKITEPQDVEVEA